MLGRQDSGVLVTLAEQKSQLYLTKLVAKKQAEVVRDTIIEMLTIKYQAGARLADLGRFACLDFRNQALD